MLESRALVTQRSESVLHEVWTTHQTAFLGGQPFMLQRL